MREIGEVGEEDAHVFGVGERHSIEREVESRRTDAAQRDVRIAGTADARLGVRVDRWRLRHQQRNVLLVVVASDVGVLYVRFRHRRRLVGANAGDDDRLFELRLLRRRRCLFVDRRTKEKKKESECIHVAFPYAGPNRIRFEGLISGRFLAATPRPLTERVYRYFPPERKRVWTSH